MAKIFKPARNNSRRASNRSAAKVVQLSIDRVDSHGQGVARGENSVVFVDGALPQEQVKATIIEQKSRYAKAQIKTVDIASSDRVIPKCEYFGSCGGCQTQYCQPLAMLTFKQAAIDQLILRTPVVNQPNPAKPVKNIADLQAQLPWQEVIAQHPWRYRRKTRLSVDGRNRQKPLIGFRMQHSRQIVSVSHCEILTASLNSLLAPLQTLFSQLSLPDGIGHIGLFDGEDKCQLCFRVVKTLSQSDRQLLCDFGLKNRCQIVLEDNQGNFESLTEDDVVSYYQVGDKVRIGILPNDFVQINADVNRVMVDQAMQWLSLASDDKVLDLYCGVGNFSLALAQHCESVLGIEGVPKMVQQAQQNAQLNGIHNCRFLHGDLNSPLNTISADVASCNKVLLDPARDGAALAMAQIASLQVSHVVYVSCNPNTFARDAAVMLANGYRIEKLAVMDMFPQTAHTELMALFVPLALYNRR